LVAILAIMARNSRRYFQPVMRYRSNLPGSNHSSLSYFSYRCRFDIATEAIQGPIATAVFAAAILSPVQSFVGECAGLALD
jgi:hypothetical protein